MPAMGAIFETIRHKLTDQFAPTRLEIEDDSARHAGHSGSAPGGESHFNVTIESERFRGAARVARQRMVYRALAAELAGPVHALSVTALAPGESA
jgi:BolA family transcriptional regulator, general stress-responsive regulator